MRVMNTDLISIIVPVYNLEKELPRCLDSILKQTYREIEVVVVDDGSSDKSADVIRKYADLDSRVRPLFKSNGGVTSARLRGVKEASGQWIGFVDGDDEIEADMYERLLNNAATYRADISHCGYQMCFSDGRVHYFHNTGSVIQQDRITALKELLSGSRVEPGLCNKLFRKTLFRSLLYDDIMPLDIKINEDLLMNFYLFSAAEQTVFDDWCPYHYIVRGTSASRAKLNYYKLYDPLRVKDIIRHKIQDELKDDAQKAYLNTCINVYNTLLQESSKEYCGEKRRVRELLEMESASFKLLGEKRKFMAKIIVGIPSLYKTIYLLYSRWFQRNVYS